MDKVYYDEVMIEDIVSEALEDPYLLKKRFQQSPLSLFVSEPHNENEVPIIDLWYNHLPKLFCCLPRNQDIETSVRKCIGLSFEYWHYKHADYKQWGELKKQTYKTKKGTKVYTERFKSHIEQLIKMLNGLKKEQGNKLQKILIDAYNNPNEYMPNMKTPQKPTTKHIKEYLQSLQIQTHLITEYLSQLSKL